MFGFQPAGARPHIHGSDTCCIVDIDISTGKRICRIDEHRPIFITQLADTQPLRINVGFGAEHTLYKLLLAHFQAEKSNCFRSSANLFGSSDRHILYHIERKSSFTHGRTGRKDDKITAMQAGGQIIKIFKACRQSGKTILIAHQRFDTLKRIKNDLIDRRKISCLLPVGNLQNLAFSTVDDVFHIIISLITHRSDLRRYGNQLTQNRFFFDNTRMIGYVGRSRHSISQRSDISDTAHILQLVVTLQNLRHRDHIHSFVLIVKLQHSVKNDAVRLTVKISIPQDLHDLGDSLFLDQHRAQH